MADIQKANEFKVLGNEAFKNKSFEAAIEHFTKAIECNPNDHTFFSNRSACYVNLQEYEKGLEDAESCIKLNPKWPRGFQRKGNALQYLDRIEEAIQTYKQGLSCDPNNADLQNNLRDAKKKVQSESPFFNRAGAQNPMMNQAYLQGLMKLISNPETKDLVNDPSFMQKMQMAMQNPALLQTFIQQDPRIAKAFEVVSKDMPQNFDIEQMFKNMNMQKADLGSKKSEKPKNEEKPQPKKEEKKPEKMQVEKKPDQIAKQKGNEAFKQKNFEQAIKHYDDAISINSEQIIYYNNKAAVYIQMGQFDKAFQEVLKAEKLFDDGIVKDWVKKAKVYARKAAIFSKQQKFDEAVNWYEKSLVEDHNQKVKDELAKVKKLKKDKQAKQYINPELAQKNNQAANALYKQGKFPQALKQYEEAVKRDPNSPKYLTNIGTCYVKLMQFARARDCFDEALSKDPNYIKAYPKKGDCHFFLKEYHKALSAFEAGLKIDPENELCKQGLFKTQQQIYNSNSSEDQEARARRAMNDPEIQQILQTPQVRNALADLQKDPKAAAKIMGNPSLAAKIQKLIEAGIIRTG